jgi:hypothetical protein
MDSIIDHAYLVARFAQTFYFSFQEFATSKFPYAPFIVLGTLKFQ